MKQLLALKSKLHKQRKPSPLVMSEIQKSKLRYLDAYQKDPVAYPTYANVSRHT